MRANRSCSVLYGTVKKQNSDGSVVVDIGDGHCIIAEVSAKIKVRFMAIEPGARVRCEVSPIAEGKRRIVGLVE
jgi:translation initiation factor IF-1